MRIKIYNKGFPGSRFWSHSFVAGQSPRPKFTTGFTLVELVISIAILSMLVLVVSTFQKDVFSLNSNLQGNLNAQLDARHVVKVMITEMREMQPSSLGAYPIALASSSAVTFYSDVDNDGLKDRVRYFVSGKDIKMGVLVPTGNPLTYNDTNEQLTTIVSDYIASSTAPLFAYYPATYTGSSAPLTYPINIPSVRLIKVTVIINKDPNRNPAPIVVTSQVNLRNLKDNQ